MSEPRPTNTSRIIREATDLPPIPAGFLRRTHFTSSKTAERLLAGEVFTFGRLDSTTDVFSNNDGVFQLATTRKVGAFERPSPRFGDSCVLIDMPNEADKVLRGNNSPVDKIPCQQIIGVLNARTMEFTPNLHYDPTFFVKKPPKIRSIGIEGRRGAHSSDPVDVPSPPSDSGAIEPDIF